MPIEQDPTASEYGDDSNEDYYLDELGRVVFTRAYHLRRGYCCKSGCRNCPYGFNEGKNGVDEAPEQTSQGV